jgi:hypothetical protein
LEGRPGNDFDVEQYLRGSLGFGRLGRSFGDALYTPAIIINTVLISDFAIAVDIARVFSWLVTLPVLSFVDWSPINIVRTQGLNYSPM